MDKLAGTIADELALDKKQVASTLRLLDEGASVPFIARYRKEATGNLQDYVIRQIDDRLASLRALEARKDEILRLIRTSLGLDEDQDLDQGLVNQIDQAQDLKSLDDLYRPYRPKRRTRASVARQKGLEPLAGLIIQSNLGEKEFKALVRRKYLGPQVPSLDEALDGARDIVAELVAESAMVRSRLRKLTRDRGILKVKAVDSKARSPYEDYYDFEEKIKNMPGHRVLAINRGHREGFLKISLEVPFDLAKKLSQALVKDQSSYLSLTYSQAVEDAYKRLLAPSIQREVLASLKESAEDEAIGVFAKNLRQALVQAPLKSKRVLAIDPGIRTGCKLVALDELGNVLDHGLIYLNKKNHTSKSKDIVKGLINTHKLNLIAIGNGTGSRQALSLVGQLIKEIDKDDLSYTMVSEAGASVYSASQIGREEFPDLDVSIRGAISIGRRIQDPLAELVKIDPKHIGIGQYQHDLNEKRLDHVLAGVVEDVVNMVGVNLNTASKSLLSYVAGLSPKVAENIVAYRNDNKYFKNRKELLKVPGLGPKTFEQAAGFLRIQGGDEPLDNTGVHPESYRIARDLLAMEYKSKDIKDLARDLNIGYYSLVDIIAELEKPGRDPRDQMPRPILRDDLVSIEDLEPGMVLKATIRNVVDFGVFVDIGLGQDGLVHISQMSEDFVKDPFDLVQIGQIVDVVVKDVDLDRERISLSMIRT